MTRFLDLEKRFFFAIFQTRISYFFTMGLSRSTAWVGGKYIGEVIFPFRTLPRKKNGSTVSIFSEFTPNKKPILLKKKKKADRTWGISWLNCVSGSQKYKSLH